MDVKLICSNWLRHSNVCRQELTSRHQHEVCMIALYLECMEPKEEAVQVALGEGRRQLSKHVEYVGLHLET